MRNLYFFWLPLVLVLADPFTLFSQTTPFTGADICIKGSIASFIYLSDSDSPKFYTVSNNKQQITFQHNFNGNSINSVVSCQLCEFVDYSTLKFDYSDIITRSTMGEFIGGTIKFNPVPVNHLKQENTKIQTGCLFTAVPETILNHTLINWTASLFDGKLELAPERGRMTYILPFELSGIQPADFTCCFNLFASMQMDDCT